MEGRELRGEGGGESAGLEVGAAEGGPFKGLRGEEGSFGVRRGSRLGLRAGGGFTRAPSLTVGLHAWTGCVPARALRVGTGGVRGGVGSRVGPRRCVQSFGLREERRGVARPGVALASLV